MACDELYKIRLILWLRSPGTFDAIQNGAHFYRPLEFKTKVYGEKRSLTETDNVSQ